MKLAAKLTEAAFQQMVVDLAHLYGWKVASFRAVRVQRKNGETYYETPVGADGKGWLDLVLAKNRFLVRELKTDTGRTTPEQDAWIAALRAAGIDAGVWRPSDWEAIESTLRG